MCLDHRFTERKEKQYRDIIAGQPLIRVHKVVRVKKRGFYPWIWSDRRIKSGERRAYIMSRAEERGWHAFLQPEYAFADPGVCVITCYAKPEWIRCLGYWARRETGVFTRLIFPKFPATNIPHLDALLGSEE